MRIVHVVITLLALGATILLGAGINDAVDSVAIRKRMNVILNSRPQEFKEKFPQMLFLTVQVNGPIQENRIFQLVEEIGQNIRQKNIYESKELKEILEKGIQRWTEAYHQELNNYRKNREPNEALAQKSTVMLNYMICSGILHYSMLNFDEAKKIFDNLNTIIPSDLWVQKYLKKIKQNT